MKRKLPTCAVTSVSYLKSIGMSQSSIARRISGGQLVPEPRARGLYTIAGNELSQYHDLQVVALRAPSAVFCLLTALQLHGLRSPAPDIWLSIPASARMPQFKLMSLVPFRPRETVKSADINVIDVDGIKLRFTSPAKTLADCFQFRSKVGLDISVTALRIARQRGVVSTDEIWHSAAANGVSTVMLPYLQAIE